MSSSHGQVSEIVSCKSPIVYSLDELLAQQRRFACFYADPPWRFDNRASRAAAENHYSTLSLKDLLDMPIGELAEPNSHLHLWVPNSLLAEGLEVIKAWGFVYKTCFVWIKPQMGMGHYWRSSHELLLLGVRGSYRFRANDLKSWKLARRTRHSSKPDVVREMIERVSPGPYLELFARRTCSGWTAFGNEVERMLF